MSRFTGIYAKFLEQYLEYKKNMGYSIASIEPCLYLFDQLTVKEKISDLGISKEIVNKWYLKRPNESNSTRYRRVMHLIHFSCYMNDLGYSSYVPRLPKEYKSTFTPYIFTREEIAIIFSTCDSLNINNLMDSTINVIPTIIRLLYATGLRVGEAINLKIEDVNLDEKYLTVHHSKNGKERLVPFSDSLAIALLQYRQSINITQTDEDYFFVKRNGEKCRAKTIYEWFRKVLLKAGISHGGKGYGPRLHDLRHAFSVNTLAAMAENGLDLYYSLPILSEYLGHQSLEATDKYVRLTSEMYPGLLNQVAGICSEVFPEVNEDEDD
jgi:integrase/recombinase XerD